MKMMLQNIREWSEALLADGQRQNDTGNKADVDGHHDAAASGWRGVICICGNAAGVSAVGETLE